MIQQLVHKGRWGFYPCEYSVYKNLKILSSASYKAERRLAEHERWNRKQPQNRVFRKKIRNENGFVIGYEKPIPRPEPVLYPNIFDGIQYNYQISRMPSSSEKEVTFLNISNEEIERRIAVLKDFEANSRV